MTYYISTNDSISEIVITKLNLTSTFNKKSLRHFQILLKLNIDNKPDIAIIFLLRNHKKFEKPLSKLLSQNSEF